MTTETQTNTQIRTPENRSRPPGRRMSYGDASPPYYQFPVFLVRSPISQTAKIVYTILYDRARLSMKNNWLDEAGNVYIVYPVAQLAVQSGRSISAVKAALKELTEAELIEKSPGGFGRPNRLYVLLPSENEPSEGSISIPMTGRFRSPSQVRKRQNQWSQCLPGGPVRPSGRAPRSRGHGFENYDCGKEDSL